MKRALLILLLLGLLAGGLYLIAPILGLPAPFTAETEVYVPPAPEAKVYGPSLIETAEPWPAPLPETADPGPVCWVLRDSQVTTSTGETLTLAEGSPCYLLEAWADGTRHLLFNEHGSFYLEGRDVDATACGVTSYEFFPDQDMRTPTRFSGAELERCLSGAMSGLGEAFAAAEETYGVNALFMIAIAQHESGNGESGLAREQNNLIGLRSGGGWASFGSYAECVDYLGAYLSEDYLDPAGSFYHGSTISGVSVTYCNSNPDWVSHIINYMQQDLYQVRGY